MNDFTPAFENTLTTLWEGKKFNTLRDILITLQPAQIAEIFTQLPEHAHPLLFRLMPKELAAETFVEMDPDQQEALIRSFSDKELHDIVSELYVDDAVDLIEEMPSNVVKRILAQTDPEMRKDINELLKYPDDSAGSIMTTEYVELKPEMDVAQALTLIRSTGIDKETVNICYVTDASRHLVGAVSLHRIVFSRDSVRIDEIMEQHVVSVGTLEDQEAVAQMFSKYDFNVMPVVDGEQRLVGIVTVDDAIDVMEEETTEDIEKMAAITPMDRPYLKTSVWDLWKSRIPWLLLMMVSATFTGIIITRFENALSTMVVLTAYIPMLMDTGGNSGSQASVTVIRGLSLRELTFADLAKVVWKESRVAVLCGVTLAAANFVKLLLFDGMLLGTAGMSPLVALVVCLTLLLTVLVAKLVGCVLPMTAQKIGFDPAVMASPFITTIVDAISLLIYFSIATALLGL